ncbi:MAG TPA: ABC transporter permease [Dongiaceae bacterium]|nr:ABC transporter permease [Dongiaceae bacterium]
MNRIIQDIRFAARMLIKNPGFSAVVVLTLGLGIGINTAIFSLVNAVLLRPLPYPEPERLVVVQKDWKSSFAHDRVLLSRLDTREVLAWQESNGAFSQQTAYEIEEATLTGRDAAESVSCGRVAASFFSMFGAAPSLGRAFLPEEDRPGGPPVALLSHRLWQRRFGGDANILGQTITLYDKPWTVVGVLPATFQFTEPLDVLVPLALSQSGPAGPHLIGRLKPGVSLDQARAGLDLIYQRVHDPNESGRVILTGLHEYVVGHVKLSLLIYLGAVGLVLLIACANVANLLLARGAGRRKEMAIRAALGAGRPRLIRQLLTESVLLASMGGLVGLLLAFWGGSLLAPLVAGLPKLQPARINGSVLAFTFLVAVSTGLVFGVVPALEGSRLSLGESLKEGTRGSGYGGRHQRRLSALLVVSEVTLASVLLLGAGLLLKSFVRLRGVDLGFRPDRILSLRVDLSKTKYPDARSQAAYFEQVIQSIRELPGVEAVGADAALPLSGVNFGMGVMSGTNLDLFAAGIVNSDYFRAMGIPLKKGRTFTDQDREGKLKVALVNESCARSRFGVDEPLGKKVAEATIVGVVGDVRQKGPKNPAGPLVYFSFLQSGCQGMSLAVRTRGDPLKLARAVRSQILRLDKDQPIQNFATLEQRLADNLSPQRVNMQVSSALGVLALSLVAVGLYGVLAFSVAQRTHEIGVRMALGAQAGDVVWLVVRQGLTLTLAGAGAGLLVAFWLTRFLSSLLYGVTAFDPFTFAAASLLLLLIALAACSIPARRAAQVDPMVALRDE